MRRFLGWLAVKLRPFATQPDVVVREGETFIAGPYHYKWIIVDGGELRDSDGRGTIDKLTVRGGRVYGRSPLTRSYGNFLRSGAWDAFHETRHEAGDENTTGEARRRDKAGRKNMDDHQGQ